MLATITTIGGLVGVMITTSLLAWQTRAAVRQAKIANAIAGSTVLHHSSITLHTIYQFFVDRPALRGHFYDGKPIPRNGYHRARLLTIAEMLADALEDGLVSHRLVPATESLADWTDYSEKMLETSPALDHMVRQHPSWWPNLSRLRASRMVEQRTR